MTKEEINNLILDNLELAYSLANKYRKKIHNLIEYEDLKSTSMLALVKAANIYKSELKNQFSTYAYIVIRNELVLFIRDNLKENRVVSLDNLVIDNVPYLELQARSDNIEADFIEQQNANELNKYINEPPDKYRIIIKLIKEGKTQQYIADLYNISQPKVNMLYKEAISLLRQKYIIKGDIRIE